VISTILVEHPWVSPTALVLLLVLGPLMGRWLTTRPMLPWLLSALALLPVALLTLVPTDRVVYERCDLAWALPTIGRVELAANVALFVAPVWLAGVALRRPLPALVAASGLSGAVELVQALVTSLGRSCSTNDWLSNTIGALIGAALAWASLALARRKPPRARSSVVRLRRRA
jgi:hypothetical protein